MPRDVSAESSAAPARTLSAPADLAWGAWRLELRQVILPRSR